MQAMVSSRLPAEKELIYNMLVKQYPLLSQQLNLAGSCRVVLGRIPCLEEICFSMQIHQLTALNGLIEGDRYRLNQAVMIAGRDLGCDLVINHPEASRKHFRLTLEDDRVELEDLKSANGVFVNGSRITVPVVLRSGDVIDIGKNVRLVYEITADPDGAVFLTQGEIKRIVRRQNLLLRNLQVTQGYYRISEGMRQVIGSTNVSWCAFATHASKTAGQALRHELMPGILKSASMRIAGHENTSIFYRHVLCEAENTPEEQTRNALAEALKTVSLMISEGNTIVFDELAEPFLDFIIRFQFAKSNDPRAFEAFSNAHFTRGRLAEGGQDYLIEAFYAFYRARFESNRKRKAELVLQGNLLIGLHEQTRLQPQIEAAMTVPLEAFIKLREDTATPAAQRNVVESVSRELVTRAATRMWMSITLPGREMKLDEDVMPPTGIHTFPRDLIKIENPRCRELVEQFDTRPETLQGSAAADWSSLRDRMNYVADFFRSHQQSRRLFEPPFQAEQAAAIESGTVPGGPL